MAFQPRTRVNLIVHPGDSEGRDRLGTPSDPMGEPFL